MTHGLDAALTSRLQAVAIDVIMPLGPGLDDAIMLADDLVAVGLGGSATLDVASLPRGSVRSAAEPGVRAMLTELGIDLPSADDEAQQYRLLLWMFGHAGLPFDVFEGPFYARLTAWDQQNDLDRALVRLLVERDEVASPSDRELIVERMRTAVRNVIPATR